MPRITEADLKKQIKSKSFSPVYLIYGSEQMFVKSYTKKLCEAVAGKNPSDFNYHTFSGDIDFQELAASLQIMPFMAERNCVVVTDIYFDNMVKDRLDTLKELTSRAWDGTVLIISMPTYVPSKNKTSFTALIKRVEKIGSVCCFEKINSQIIEKYVAKWANENGKLISHLNASKIISNVGDDLNLLKNEVNKIAAYAKGEEITDRDIDLLSTVNLEARTYDMADDVINGRGDRAFRKLDTLFCQREEPINILYALSSAYVDAYRMRVADECSVSKETVAKDFAYKNRAFVLNRARTSVEGRYDKIKLSSIVDAPIIETNGFRVFSDKEKQSLIRKIAETRGILIMTDSDGAGFVIRNFLKGSVDNSKIKNCYIPQIKGKDKCNPQKRCRDNRRRK